MGYVAFTAVWALTTYTNLWEFFLFPLYCMYNTYGIYYHSWLCMYNT